MNLGSSGRAVPPAFMAPLLNASWRTTLHFAVAVTLTLLAWHADAKAAHVAAAKTWDAFTNDFIQATFKARPYHAVWAGRHDYDGRLPDWSVSGIRKEIDRLHAARRRAVAFDDKELSEKQRFERDYLIATIDDDLFWFETARWPARSPTFYGWGLDPEVYVAREYAPLTQRMRAYVAYAKAIPRAVHQMRRNLRTPLPRSYVRIGHITAGGLAAFFENDVPVVFGTVQDPHLQAEFRTANVGAIKAMKELDKWFTRQEAGATEDFALGEQQFAAMLHATNGIDVPLAHLKEIAERDLERNLAALRDACNILVPGGTIEACVTKVRADKLTGPPVQAGASQLVELRSFVEEKKLVTIPGVEQALVAEAPPYERWNAAYIRIPGPYDKSVPATYYIAPPDPKWTKAEQEAYVPAKTDLLFISAHEVWPGHFLQFQHSNRSSSMVGRLFINYAFAEG